MTQETTFCNARIVLADDVVHGSVLVRDGRVADVGEGASTVGEDFGGDYLIPGLVELHTDHLESHVAPRPGVIWNPVSALLAHDAQVAAAGITTVCDALRVGMDEDSRLKAKDMRVLGDAIHRAAGEGILRAEHFIHLRCEVAAEDVYSSYELFDGDERVRLASLMDHTPGQRQFVNLDKHRQYYQGKSGLTDRDYFALVERLQAKAGQWSDANRQRIAAACQARGVHLASHDDATEQHVREAARDGIVIAEFPTTVEAARTAQEHGMKILMGSPNVVRGMSHSGNVSAIELARGGHLDILSSDYVPLSLMQAVFSLAEAVEEISLPRAVAMVSRTPAQAIGLDDRGAIAPGLRADLVRVRLTDGPIPVVRGVWREGERVA